MSNLKFALGAAVVLVTSVPHALDDLADAKEIAERPAQDEGDDFAIGRIRVGTIEQGNVIGRSEYVNAPPSYLVRYRDGNGCQVENWFTEDALTTHEAIKAEFDAQQGSGAGGGYDGQAES